MDTRYIYLIFTKTGTWLSRFITTFSDMKYVHSSISFDNSFKKMYSFGRTNPNNPFSGGFVEEDLQGGVYQKFANTQCLIYKVKVTQEQYDSLKQQVSRFLEEPENFHYSILGLMGVKIGVPIKRKNHYFCSQFVSELLINSNLYDQTKNPALVVPEDLYEVEDMEFIYEGHASLYPGMLNLPLSTLAN